jgi:3',5'-cyclic AMP phosphodiesterase CpdA
LHRFESLGLLVAALNSTIKESHRGDDHYGWCGEAQLQWFAEQLKDGSDLMRIGVVHHHLRAQGGTIDSECLRDLDSFTQLLAPHLDLVLHGHTHDGRSDRLSNGTLVLATGSAAVLTPPSREDGDTHNQYQIVRLGPGRVTRWARAYVPKQRRWVGDTSLSEKGDTWSETIKERQLAGVQSARRHAEALISRAKVLVHQPDLLSEIEQVAKVRTDGRCAIE